MKYCKPLHLWCTYSGVWTIKVKIVFLYNCTRKANLLFFVCVFFIVSCIHKTKMICGKNLIRKEWTGHRVSLSFSICTEKSVHWGSHLSKPTTSQLGLTIVLILLYSALNQPWTITSAVFLISNTDHSSTLCNNWETLGSYHLTEFSQTLNFIFLENGENLNCIREVKLDALGSHVGEGWEHMAPAATLMLIWIKKTYDGIKASR